METKQNLQPVFHYLNASCTAGISRYSVPICCTSVEDTQANIANVHTLAFLEPD